MHRGFWLVVALCAAAPGWGAPEDPINVDLADVPFVQAVQQIAAAGGMKVVVGHLGAQPGRITVSFTNIASRTAMDRLMRLQPNLELVAFDDVLILRAKEAAAMPAPTKPVALPPTPAPRLPGAVVEPAAGMPGVAPAPSAGHTGTPVLGTKRYVRIPIYYAYAPGLAEALGGNGLRLADIDPWVGGLAQGFGAGQSGRLQNGGGGFGGGLQSGGFGGGGRTAGGFGNQSGAAGTGRQVFELPDGIDELVGVDWIGSMVAR